MGFIARCPLIGERCDKTITIQEKTFFLAEAEKPEENKKRRRKAINQALGVVYIVRSALDERGINAFTCKICELIQSCAYGIADITERNPNVILELGMMLALGKPAVILQKRGEEGLNLPSDLNAIEVIPFDEYIDIIEPLHEIAKKLPSPVTPTSPIQDLESIRPDLAKEFRGELGKVVQEFREAIEQAKLDTAVREEKKKEVSPELSETIARLGEKLEEMERLGFATDAQTAFYRGNSYFEQGKYDKALAYYNRSVKLRPDAPDILNNRGSAYFKLQSYKEALADYNRSLELKPDNPDALSNRGTTYAKLERYEEALADYSRSLELKPDDPGTLSNLGATYSKLKRHKEALADCNRSLELKPDNPDALNNRGGVYFDLKRYEEALADYNRSLELGPDDPATLSNRGGAYFKLERQKEALADNNRSLELRPDDPGTLNNRGTVYSALERYDEALADYNRSLELRPDYPDTFYNLACLLSLQNKADDALIYLEKAIKGDEKCRQEAKDDKDFDNIRADPRFKKLIETS